MAQDAMIRRLPAPRHARRSRHDGQVRPANLPLLHLVGNGSVRFTSPREHEYAGRVPFESLMNAEVSCGFSLEAKVFGQTPHDVVIAFRRMRGQKGRFVDNDHVRVFMKNAA